MALKQSRGAREWVQGGKGKRVNGRRSGVAGARAEEGGGRKTVADTRRAFLREHPYPLPPLWSSVVNELLVQQHLYNQDRRYHHSAVAALGLVSIFDQIMERFPREGAAGSIFNAFFRSLDEDPQQYRSDHDSLLSEATSKSSVEELENLNAIQELKRRASDGSSFYTKFQAIGLFKLLECIGSTDPDSLQRLTNTAGVNIDKANTDLQTYKQTLQKLQQAREMQDEAVSRDRAKREEREKAKEGDGNDSQAGQEAASSEKQEESASSAS
jgi:photosystem II biogenesis protein Psp29